MRGRITIDVDAGSNTIRPRRQVAGGSLLLLHFVLLLPLLDLRASTVSVPDTRGGICTVRIGQAIYLDADILE